MKEPLEFRASPGGLRNEQIVAVPVIAYPPYDSPLFDALIDGEKVHQLLVDSQGDYAIFVLDANGIVASWNKGAQQIKGYTRDEILGTHFSLFYPDTDRAREKPERELVIATRERRFEKSRLTLGKLWNYCTAK